VVVGRRRVWRARRARRASSRDASGNVCLSSNGTSGTPSALGFKRFTTVVL
jgi:hypothetical protein